MPDLRTTRRRRSSDHSLLISLGVTFLLILGYALGLKVYAATSMADAVVNEGVSDVAQKVYTNGDEVYVELSSGAKDTLNYVSDPADYRAPLAVRHLRQRSGDGRELVIAEQDLEHLRGAERKRAITIGAGIFVVVLVGAGVYLNWPRRPEEED